MMETAYRYMPWLNIVVVAADRAFDREETGWLAEQKWGCHPVVTRRDKVGTYFDFAADEGCPRCPRHGELMGQVSGDHFYDAHKRGRGLRLDPKVFPARAGKTRRGCSFTFDEIKQRIVCDSGEMFTIAEDWVSSTQKGWFVQAPPGVDIRPLVDLGLLPRAVIKWQCRHDGCPEPARTYPGYEKVLGRRAVDGVSDRPQDPSTGWRLYTWAPRRPVALPKREDRHVIRMYTWAPRRPVALPKREDRHAVRQDVTARHWSRVEGYNGEQRDRGITMEGNQRARAVKTRQAMLWLVGLRALRHNLIVMVRRDGTYKAAHELAAAEDLLRAPTVEDLAAHRARRGSAADQAA